MAEFWKPPVVSQELREESAQREGQAGQGLMDRDDSFVEQFNRDLHAVMPGMKLVWCTDPAPVDAVAMGARPGRWGIRMPSIKGGPVTVEPLIGPDGEYVEPGSWVFDVLRSQDWWNPQVQRERERAQAEAERAAEKRKQQERDEMTQDILENFLAKNRAFVSTSTDTPWTQNQAGRRAAKKETS